MKKVYCVISHTHWDREWYRSFEGFRMRLVDLINHLLEIIDEYPEYIFHLDAQTVVLEDYLQIYPENRALLEQHIKNGNILVGPWYLQNDFYLTSGEATIRNLLKGTRIAESFGKCTKIGYAPDQFGNISQLPQILRNFGIDNFIFGRGYNPYAVNEKGEKYLKYVPPEFYWCGPDGSKLLAVHMRYWYNNAQRFSADIEKAEILLQGVENSFKDICVTPYYLLMNGVDHLEAQDDLIPVLEQLNKCEINGTVKQTSMTYFIDSLRSYLEENKIELTEFDGELRHGWDGMILQGTLSSRHYLKVANVKAQNLLENRIEPLYSMLSLNGFEKIYPHNYMNYVWKLLLENHPHDSICGCSRDEVHRHMEDRFQRVNEVGGELMERALDIAAYHNGTAIDDSSTYSMIVANTVCSDFNGTVEAKVVFPESEQTENFEIKDADGKNVEFVVVDKKKEIYDTFSPINLPGKINVDAYTVYFNAENIKALSIAGYQIKKIDGKAEIINRITDNVAQLENDAFKITVGEDGKIDIFSKKHNRTLSDCIYFEDTADIGSAYTFGNAGDKPIRSSELKPCVCVLEKNAYRTVCSIKWNMMLPESYDFANKMRTEKTVCNEAELILTLKSGYEYVNIDYKINNKSSYHRLRLVIKSDICSDRFVADTPFDIIVRRDDDVNPTVSDNVLPNTSFAAIENEKQVTCVFTEGAHECAKFSEDKLAFTVIRATGAIDPNAGATWQSPENQCLRMIEGRCGIYLGEHNDFAELLAHSVKFRNPPICHVRPSDPKKFTGGRPAVQDTKITETFYMKDKNTDARISSESAASVDNSTVVLTALKRSEDNEFFVARLFNPSATQQKATFNAKGSIYRANMNEELFEMLGKQSVEITLKPKEILTFGIKD